MTYTVRDGVSLKRDGKTYQSGDHIRTNELTDGDIQALVLSGMIVADDDAKEKRGGRR